jgi:hypothetical protein
MSHHVVLIRTFWAKAHFDGCKVRTIIDLRHRPNDRVRQLAERAGLRYINLPMNVRGYPPDDLAPRFLALVNDLKAYIFDYYRRLKGGLGFVVQSTQG